MSIVNWLGAFFIRAEWVKDYYLDKEQSWRRGWKRDEMTNFKKCGPRTVIYRSGIEDPSTYWTFTDRLAGDSRTCARTLFLHPCLSLDHLVTPNLNSVGTCTSRPLSSGTSRPTSVTIISKDSSIALIGTTISSVTSGSRPCINPWMIFLEDCCWAGLLDHQRDGLFLGLRRRDIFHNQLRRCRLFACLTGRNNRC